MEIALKTIPATEYSVRHVFLVTNMRTADTKRVEADNALQAVEWAHRVFTLGDKDWQQYALHPVHVWPGKQRNICGDWCARNEPFVEAGNG